MMKYVLPFALAGLVTLASVPVANATTSYCGYSSEATDSTFPASVTINGHTVGALKEQTVLDGSLGTDGEVYRGNHRYCGEIAVYMFTGTSLPVSYFAFDLDLNPNIVDYTVAQVKCTATMMNVEDIYSTSIGVTAGDVYNLRPVFVYFQKGAGYDAESPPRRHITVIGTFPNGVYMDENKVYGVTINCPTNVPPTE